MKEIYRLCLPQCNHAKFLFDPLGKAAGKILLMGSYNKDKGSSSLESQVSTAAEFSAHQLE